MIEIFSLKLPNTFSSKDLTAAMNNISDSKRNIIKKYIHKNDKLRSLLSDLLVRYIIIHEFHLKNSELIFMKNNFGKPFAQNVPGFHYNISHSDEWIVCAVHSQEIGIDIEKVRYLDFNILIQSFSDYEKSYFKNNNVNNISEPFFYLWTLKESYIKALGKGLYVPLNSFTIKHLFSKHDISVHTNYYDTDFYFKKYNYHDNYIFSVCAKVNNFPVSITEITIKDILNHNFFQ